MFFFCRWKMEAGCLRWQGAASTQPWKFSENKVCPRSCSCYAREIWKWCFHSKLFPVSSVHTTLEEFENNIFILRLSFWNSGRLSIGLLWCHRCGKLPLFVFCLVHVNSKPAFSNPSSLKRVSKKSFNFSWWISVDSRSEGRNKTAFSNMSSIVDRT